MDNGHQILHYLLFRRKRFLLDSSPSEFSKSAIKCMLFERASSSDTSAVHGEVIFGCADYRSGIEKLQKP